jgi:hypothetical protein
MVELKPSIWVNMTLLYQHYPNIIPSKIQSFIITFPGITWSFLAHPCHTCQANSADPQQLGRIQTGTKGEAPSDLTRLGLPKGSASDNDRCPGMSMAEISGSLIHFGYFFGWLFWYIWN